MKRRPKILLFLFLILLCLGGFFGFGKNFCRAEEDNLFISEIMYNPDGSDTGKEWIELFNNTDGSISMESWTLKTRGSSGSNNFLFPVFELQKNSFIVIHLRTTGTNSTTDLYQNSTSGSNLGDSKGSVSLYNASNKIVDFIEYGAGGQTFETDATKAGIWTKDAFIPSTKENYTLEVISGLGSNNNPSDWQESYTAGGTPGKENSKKSEDDLEDDDTIPLCEDFIILSEIYPFNGEFVEVENVGTEKCDLAGWKISDEKNTPRAFPEKSFIDPNGYVAFVRDFGLNSTSADSAKLFNLTDSEPIEIRSYENPENNKSYSKDESEKWLWTSLPTKGTENQFDPVEDTSDTTTETPIEDTSPDYNVYLNEILPNPKGDEKLGEFIELFNAEDLEINLAGWTLKDASKTKYIFPADTKIAAKKYLVIYRPDFKFAMNNSGPETIYLLNTANEIVSSVSYDDAKEDASYNFDDTDWHWSSFLTPSNKNEFEKKSKVSIVKIKANPKGNDTDKKNGEEIYLKNNSKKKVNLKGWSIASGSKTLANHPITKDFIIKPGKTKKITRKYSLFTLNNKKGAIELRHPNGEVASRVKYDKKKETIKDDEVYELSGKKWQWSAPSEETSSEKIIPEENPETTHQEVELNISAEEIFLNLGKYSSENKLALVENGFMPVGKNILQSRENSGIVLGAFSVRNEISKPIEIKPTTSWNKTLQKSNQLFNLLINQLINLI